MNTEIEVIGVQGPRIGVHLIWHIWGFGIGNEQNCSEGAGSNRDGLGFMECRWVVRSENTIGGLTL